MMAATPKKKIVPFAAPGTAQRARLPAPKTPSTVSRCAFCASLAHVFEYSLALYSVYQRVRHLQVPINPPRSPPRFPAPLQDLRRLRRSPLPRLLLNPLCDIHPIAHHLPLSLTRIFLRHRRRHSRGGHGRTRACSVSTDRLLQIPSNMV